jgi:hypothetical protein
MAPQKGKQGTKGGKQIVEENAATLQFYRNMIFGANGAYFVLMSFLSEGYTFWDIVLFLFGALVTIACFQFMNFMAKPKFSETGQLLDSGVDLNMESGVAEHVKDVLILTCACQVVSFFTKYAWFFWLLVPLKGFYYAWTKLISPWVFAPAPEATAGDEKKQRKFERKMRR